MDFLRACRQDDVDFVESVVDSEGQMALNTGFVHAALSRSMGVMRILAGRIDLFMAVLRVLIPACQDGDIETLKCFLDVFPRSTDIHMTAHLESQVQGPVNVLLHSIGEILEHYSDLETIALVEAN